MGSRIRWRILQLNGVSPTTQMSVRCVLYPSVSNAALTVIADAAVQRYSRVHTYPLTRPSGSGGVSSDNPKSEWVGRHAMTIGKIFGETELRTPSYEALVAADPSSIGFWNFVFQDQTSDATGKPQLLFDVDIVYDCLFFQRKTQVNALEKPTSMRIREVLSEEKKAPPVPFASPLRLPSAPPGYVLVKSLPQLD